MSDVEQWRPNRGGAFIALDTGYLRDPRIEQLTGRADVLYLAMLLYCGDELSDGHVPARALRRLTAEARARPGDIAQLESAGLVDNTPDGWHIPRYCDWNPTRTHLRSQLEANRERQRRFRAARAANPDQHTTRNALQTPLRNGLGDALVTQPRSRSRSKPPQTPPYGENTNGTTPSTYRDPSSTCPDCGERYGHGHAENCPRMPTVVDPAA